MVHAQRPRVVVVGGGFGGLYAARALARADVDVVLVDKATSHLFQPLLYQCATGVLSLGQITSPLRALLRRHANVEVKLAEAIGLDADRRVLVGRRPDGSTGETSYDHLVVAAGMQQSYFGRPEFARYAPGMKTLDDALDVRRRILGAFEMADVVSDPELRRAWLTFAVVGGGPTGVELAGQIRELAAEVLRREFHDLDTDQARVLLFDGGDAVLRSFGPGLARRAARILRRLRVETVLGVHVTDIDDTGLTATAKDGSSTRYDARTVLWTAGVEAVPFLAAVARAVGVEPDRQGRIPVQPDLTVAGHPEIRVVGDVMSLDGLPGVAEVAMQSGWHAGAEIRRTVEDPGRTGLPFRYRDLGSAAYISRGHALMSAGPIRLSGVLGWLGWGVIHIAFLSGALNRVTTLTSWLWVLLLRRRAERALLSTGPGGLLIAGGGDGAAAAGSRPEAPAPDPGS